MTDPQLAETRAAFEAWSDETGWLCTPLEAYLAATERMLGVVADREAEIALLGTDLQRTHTRIADLERELAAAMVDAKRYRALVEWATDPSDSYRELRARPSLCIWDDDQSRFRDWTDLCEIEDMGASIDAAIQSAKGA